MSEGQEDLPLDQRRAMFSALVAAQDEGLSVPESRDVIAHRYGVTAARVKEIEDEGLDRRWPPFGK